MSGPLPRQNAECESAQTAALMWSRKCIELEGGTPTGADGFNTEGLAAIARALRLPVSAILASLATEGADDGR